MGEEGADALLQVLAGLFDQFQAGGFHGGEAGFGLGLLGTGAGQQFFRFLAQLGYHRPLLLEFGDQAVGGKLGGSDAGTGICQYFRSQAQAVGDGKGVAATGEAQGQPVGGFQGAGVQVHAGVDHAGLLLDVAGHAPVVGGSYDHHVQGAEVTEQGLGQGGALLRVGAGAQFVNEHQGVGGCLVQDGAEVLDVGAESGQGLLDALLVADVGKDAVEQGKLGGLGGDVQAGVGHQGQQAGGLQSYGFAPGVGAGYCHDPDAPAQLQADGHHPVGEQGVAGAGYAEAWFDRLTMSGRNAAWLDGSGRDALTPGPSPRGRGGTVFFWWDGRGLGRGCFPFSRQERPGARG